ncbi:unnamed protein product [Clonostachys solani]|uniref:Rho coiled-coil associated kinase alpha n=1 Tax=Clonostachys solani TaxID=160281 RepID=A0A9N9Z3E0_9HYPO|nr:unnamed protein product [Clonostachys solani]
MEAEARYRSRILREMEANRNNPFNSPPSSTGSHGTVSPTMSSVFSDPDGESTRRLNEDIARVTAPRKLPVNWEAAHRKWPEFYSMPKSRDLPILDDDTDTRPLSPELKENKPHVRSARFTMDDTTQDIWNGSARTRSEMQPRADTESDLSSLISKSPARVLSVPNGTKNARQPSPLSKTYTRSISESHHQQRRTSLTEALEQLRANSASPRNREQRKTSSSPQMSSAKSSLTAVAPSPAVFDSPGQDMSHVRSFFMPDVSHLGDFVTGTLRFSGSMRNGVPIFVKHGNVHDRQEKPHLTNHADVDGLEVPEDEEKIFVSMDMIREEIISLQDHYEKVQEYASNLQSQVEALEAQLKARPTVERRSSSERPNEQLLRQKESLEIELTTLQSRLEQASRKISLTEIEKDSLIQEKDRAVRKLQEACDDINKLTRKLSIRERELENSQRVIESTEQHRLETDTLKRDLLSLKHGRDALELENTSLRTDNDALHQEKRELEEEIEAIRSENESLRRKNEALLSEAKSLRSNNQNLATEDEDLRDNLDGVQHELDAAIEQVQTLQQKVEEMSQERTTLREDNNSLVRHNEKYFEENKILRRENSGFEQSIHALRDENVKLKEDVDFMKQQMDHCRPIPKEDLLAQLDDETGENMTSAFFIPDITMNSNDSEALAEITDTKGGPVLPELTTQNTRLSTIPDLTEEPTNNSVQVHEERKDTHQRSSSTSKSQKQVATSSKVAFAIPDASVQSTKSKSNARSNVANQGSKRRSSKSSHASIMQKSPFRGTEPLSDVDDTTGVVSMDEMTQEQSVDEERSHKQSHTEERSRQIQTLESHSRETHKTRRRSSHSQNHSQKIALEVVSEDHRTAESCRTLSQDARRVLDGLCEHSCTNCTVCARIASHNIVVSSNELASGKKRITVSRPVPVSDRNLTGDHTLRPAQAPGHALAMVIKGLEDESHHLQLELSRLQAKYNGTDKALGRRERLRMAEGIRALLKQVEAKNDQIYSLYDVLEGQKAAGQAMSDEELEMTVLNITGMTVRDVTSGSEHLTWEGIEDL